MQGRFEGELPWGETVHFRKKFNLEESELAQLQASKKLFNREFTMGLDSPSTSGEWSGFRLHKTTPSLCRKSASLVSSFDGLEQITDPGGTQIS